MARHAAATDFNISDEIDDENETGNDPATHAGDEEHHDDEDRGDVVQPGQGAEGDPEARAAADEPTDEPIDPALLDELANNKPGMVPIARLNEVLAREARLLAALEAVAGAGKAAPAAQAEPAAPAFDLKAKLKEQNAALLEGDEDKALEIAMQIEEHRTTTVAAKVRAETLQEVEGRQQKTQADTIIANAFGKYTFLNNDSDDHNPEALEEVLMYRNHFLSKGDSLPNALQKAIDKVCPQYAEADPAATATPAATGARNPDKVVRNATAARAQPAELGKAGVPNKQAIDTSKLNLETMTDDEYEALPAAVKAKLRGDGG